MTPTPTAQQQASYAVLLAYVSLSTIVWLLSSWRPALGTLAVLVLLGASANAVRTIRFLRRVKAGNVISVGDIDPAKVVTYKVGEEDRAVVIGADRWGQLVARLAEQGINWDLKNAEGE